MAEEASGNPSEMLGYFDDAMGQVEAWEGEVPKLRSALEMLGSAMADVPDVVRVVPAALDESLESAVADQEHLEEFVRDVAYEFLRLNGYEREDEVDEVLEADGDAIDVGPADRHAYLIEAGEEDAEALLALLEDAALIVPEWGEGLDPEDPEWEPILDLLEEAGANMDEPEYVFGFYDALGADGALALAGAFDDIALHYESNDQTAAGNELFTPFLGGFADFTHWADDSYREELLTLGEPGYRDLDEERLRLAILFSGDGYYEPELQGQAAHTVIWSRVESGRAESDLPEALMLRGLTQAALAYESNAAWHFIDSGEGNGAWLVTHATSLDDDVGSPFYAGRLDSWLGTTDQSDIGELHNLWAAFTWADAHGLTLDDIDLDESPYEFHTTEEERAQYDSLRADFIPIVSEVKAGYEVVAGTDPITGDEANRWMSLFWLVVPFGVVGVAKAIKAARAARVTTPTTPPHPDRPGSRPDQPATEGPVQHQSPDAPAQPRQAPFADAAEADFWGQTNWRHAHKSLTPEERNVIQSRTDDSLTDVNDPLRGDRQATPDELADIDALDLAISRQSTPERVTAIRWDRSSDIFRGEDISTLHLSGPRTYDTYMGTSLDPNFEVHGRDVKLTVDIPEGTPAHYLPPNSDNPDELELLLQRGLQYEVTNPPQLVDGVWHVDIRILPDGRLPPAIPGRRSDPPATSGTPTSPTTSSKPDPPVGGSEVWNERWFGSGRLDRTPNGDQSTYPTKPPDPDRGRAPGEPEGGKSKKSRKLSPQEQENMQNQIDDADLAYREGLDIEHSPADVTNNGGSVTADYGIGGHLFEHKVAHTNNVRSFIDNNLQKSAGRYINEGVQADRFIVNLDHSTITPDAIREDLLARKEGPDPMDVQEVFVVKDGEIWPIFP